MERQIGKSRNMVELWWGLTQVPPDDLAGRVEPQSRMWPQGTRPHQIQGLGKYGAKMAQDRSCTIKSLYITESIK